MSAKMAEIPRKVSAKQEKSSGHTVSELNEASKCNQASAARCAGIPAKCRILAQMLIEREKEVQDFGPQSS